MTPLSSRLLRAPAQAASDLAGGLLALARGKDRSVSWVLRRALREYLERRRPEIEETT